MDKKVTIELNNGQMLEAFWARPFVPAEKEVAILLAESKERRVFSLSQVSCILLPEIPLPNMQPKPDDPLEVVECVTGRTFGVRTLKAFQLPEGFFAVPIDKTISCALIFFTVGGLRSRTKLAPLGQILEEHGVLSRDDLNVALVHQQHLRKQRLEEILSQEHQLAPDVIEQVIRQAHADGKTDKWPRVGDILVSAGLVTREQVEAALASKEAGKRKKIGRLLIERGLVSEEQVLAALAAKFNLPFIDLDKQEVDPEVLAAISPELVMQFKVFPVADMGDYLLVATSRPNDHTISDSLRFHINRRVLMVIAGQAQIQEYIARYYPEAIEKHKELLEDIGAEEVVLDEDDDDTVAESDSETIRLANRILVDAYHHQASDIHLEPGAPKQPMGVRYRIDGICRVIQMLPSRFSRPLVARMKVMANLDIAEHRRAQSGKILIRLQGKKIEYRLEITPTVGGHEDAVLRILTGHKPIPLAEMGLSTANLADFQELVVKPYGIILCVGPTGSGKTTTLHAALGFINNPERKIWTVEDPVEITQPGLRQVQVNTQIGLTFQIALRSLLRADPDVVMIGEMRDRDATHTAIEASLTGHLVFSTLHTNNAPETVIRLIEMGEDPFNLADSLLGILAQRLARKLCLFCKETYHPSQEEYAQLSSFYGEELFREHGCPEYSENLTLMRKVGCEKCGNLGYEGRIAIHELLICSALVKETIKSKAAVTEIQKIAVAEGMRTLRMDGVAKVLAGLTDLEQVQRVCL
ncbi:MAG: Flp pilus assembly complex ATPase component TadA [Desulfobulbaceae bacterium]|nr:Flp pilus assembly complex ATPase component TadA [Desulfobulbaceae bacterium]